SSRRLRGPGWPPRARTRPCRRRRGWLDAWSGRTRLRRPAACPSGTTPLEDADQVLLEAWPAGGVGHAPARFAGVDAVGDLRDPGEPRHHHGVGLQSSAGRVDVLVPAESEGVAEDQLV